MDSLFKHLGGKAHLGGQYPPKVYTMDSLFKTLGGKSSPRGPMPPKGVYNGFTFLKVRGQELT